jgi:hypothetical protein
VAHQSLDDLILSLLMFLNLLIEWGRYSRGVCSGLAMMNVGSPPFFFNCSYFWVYLVYFFKTFFDLFFFEFLSLTQAREGRSLSLTLSQEETVVALMIAEYHT